MISKSEKSQPKGAKKKKLNRQDAKYAKNAEKGVGAAPCAPTKAYLCRSLQVGVWTPAIIKPKVSTSAWARSRMPTILPS